ncbi:cytochrome-c peroxidase [Flavobacterium sp. HJ-32-4]|uniref:cytochrome-c peroxidase n=1 Tax=Flavobacterium sp. HJ-32-4 TaxID=1160795 RepID=UPI001F147063|nr:cytochrome c peroxidase [Flavobacterium sp. HJ-32-4]UMY66084.1 cytochrome-c peroxidase [Flavobacterium sp. HJ-32-4]
MKYLSFFITLLLCCGCQNEPRSLTVKESLLRNIDSLESEVVHFRDLAKQGATEAELAGAFRQCRLLYKKTEWAVEYFQPSVARFINGPALDETEAEENRFFPPGGFQVVEELLFPSYDGANRDELVREIGVLLSNIRQIRTHLDAVNLSDDYVVDALQQEFARIVALGITGFDSPVALYSIPETEAALASAKELLPLLQSHAASDPLEKALAYAHAFCASHRSFNSFNRADFMTRHMIPIGREMLVFRKRNHIRAVNRNEVVRNDKATFFDADAFNPDAFIPSGEYAYSAEKAALGEALFYDTRLSKSNDRSCATCHHPEKAFTDGLATNHALSGKNLARNTPTLTYAGFQNALFWDLRQPDLEKQSLDVINNKEEMHGTLEDMLPLVNSDKKYGALWQAAFPNERNAKNWQLQNALATYIRSLSPFDSRFDAYMRGDARRLTRTEIAGLNLFMGKAKCATCHFVPLFNGTVPPRYAKTEQEVLGTPETLSETAISDDPGRYGITQLPQFRNAFKTPTLRNVAVTAPYMHNGVYRTLEQVVEFYNKGGGRGLGYPVDNQTLPDDPLNLTKHEKAQLVAFLKTLTDSKYAQKQK